MHSLVSHKLVGILLSAVTALAGVLGVEPAGGAVGEPQAGAAAEAAAPPQDALYRAAPADRRQDGVVRQAAAGTDEHPEVLAYWTRQRMAEATPLAPYPNDLADGPLPSTGDAQHQAAGGSSTGKPWRGGGRVARTTGKVFLTFDGRDSTCTASVVSADNRDTVITAGHCLKDGTGPWAANWAFVPGYDDGDSPHGRYTARQMFVAPQWADGADDSYDFGMAVLNRSDGAHVQDQVGAQPIAFGVEPTDPTFSFGYPATGRYQGRRLHYCSGSTVDDEGGTTAKGMACRMTQGSSGGPWFDRFDEESGKGTLVSVTSFKYADDSRTHYGPHLGGAAREVYKRARSY
ncbi:trypsin-like serine peptidase [Streptomonospora wellingtoniae]|uniref:Trypsin-like serine protease n=1 Tax=Streptomonospora wellingtoniae TaxID=3075544 RepID=A0ABU2KZA2_9ACTN|nr:trypsin-like serine protease [Streptomonospora sp. DSM 45055]MDT0304629.1 trypsin-like serine protease [Streptomonospora sp. DSM 45055]